MAIDLRFKTEENYLHVQASGVWDAVGAKKALTQVREKADEKQRTSILIDCIDLRQPIVEMHRYYTGEAIAQILGRPYKTVAYMQEEESNKFLENVAINRGADFFVTKNYHKALNWLLPMSSIPNLNAAKNTSRVNTT